VDPDYPDSSGIRVCYSCIDAASGFARRTVQHKVYVSTSTATVSATGGPLCAGTVLVYVDDQTLTFAHSLSAACLTANRNARIVQGLTYPSRSVPLGSFIQGLDNCLIQLSDDRPW
jgi:hypothetical protein